MRRVSRASLRLPWATTRPDYGGVRLHSCLSAWLTHGVCSHTRTRRSLRRAEASLRLRRPSTATRCRLRLAPLAPASSMNAACSPLAGGRLDSRPSPDRPPCLRRTGRQASGPPPGPPAFKSLSNSPKMVRGIAPAARHRNGRSSAFRRAPCSRCVRFVPHRPPRRALALLRRDARLHSARASLRSGPGLRPGLTVLRPGRAA